MHQAEIQASFLGSSWRSSQNNCRGLGGICLNVPYAIISPQNSEDIRHPSQSQGGREDREDISSHSYKSCRCCLDTCETGTSRLLLCFSEEMGSSPYIAGVWQGGSSSKILFSISVAEKAWGLPGGASWRCHSLFCPFQNLETLPSLSVVVKHRTAAEHEHFAGGHCSATCCHSCTKATKCTRDQKYVYIGAKERHSASESFQISKGTFCVCALNVSKAQTKYGSRAVSHF